MFGSIGFPEIIMIFIVVLLVFGPKKLPEIAKMMGKTIRDFKRTVNDAKATIEEEFDKADITKDIKDLKDNIDITQDLKEMEGDIKQLADPGLNDDQDKTG